MPLNIIPAPECGLAPGSAGAAAGRALSGSGTYNPETATISWRIRCEENAQQLRCPRRSEVFGQGQHVLPIQLRRSAQLHSGHIRWTGGWRRIFQRRRGIFLSQLCHQLDARFRPEMINEFRLGYNRINAQRLQLNANTNVSADPSINFPAFRFRQESAACRNSRSAMLRLSAARHSCHR